MCTLIYAVAPNHAELTRVRALEAVRDDDIATRLRAGEVLCRVVGIPQCAGGGHCGTLLGSAARSAATLKRAAERDRRQAEKLRRLGWSEHKVSSWLAQRTDSRGHHGASPENERALWDEVLRSTLNDGRLSYLGLMVVEAGHVVLRDEDLRLGALQLEHFELGVLYRIHR